MPNEGRIAMLLDGGYVTKRFRRLHRRFPSASDVATLCSTIRASSFPQCELYRVFFYDCEPYTGTENNPISGSPVDYSKTKIATQYRSLLDGLEHTPDFAVRRGDVLFHGWKLGDATLRSITPGSPPPALTERSFVPDLSQKGVDMRIGLDIAALSLKRLVSSVVLVTGDSDMVPAMRFARREGLRVYLHTMGYGGVRSELKAHADIVL